MLSWWKRKRGAKQAAARNAAAYEHGRQFGDDAARAFQAWCEARCHHCETATSIVAPQSLPDN
jgi:hypothetical protein